MQSGIINFVFRTEYLLVFEYPIKKYTAAGVFY